MKIALIFLAIVSAALAVPLGDSSTDDATFVPFIVSITQARFYSDHVASGSIINNRFILSSARRFSGAAPSEFNVLANIQETWAGSREQYRLEQIIIHPNFVRETNQNDIALLRTTTDIIFNDQVQPIPLSQLILSNQDAVFSGFGFTESQRSTHIPLINVNFRTISNAECRTILGAENAALLFDTKACVLPSDNRVICSNDYGAPLTINNQVIAVSSWNVPCTHNSPIIVERVSAHLDFIQGNIA